MPKNFSYIAEAKEFSIIEQKHGEYVLRSLREWPENAVILHKIAPFKLCNPTKMQFSEKTFKKPVRKWAKKLFIYVEGIPCIKTEPLTEVQKFGIIDAKYDASKRKE